MGDAALNEADVRELVLLAHRAVAALETIAAQPAGRRRRGPRRPYPRASGDATVAERVHSHLVGSPAQRMSGRQLAAALGVRVDSVRSTLSVLVDRGMVRRVSRDLYEAA